MVIVSTQTYVRSISVPNYLPCLHRPSACAIVTEARHFQQNPVECKKGAVQYKMSSTVFIIAPKTEHTATVSIYTPWQYN